MSSPWRKALLGLQSSSLFRAPPKKSNLEHQAEVLVYVDLFGQLASDSFDDDVGGLVRSNYPSEENRLLDDVLATFVLHLPELGHAVLHALLSCVIDGTVFYDKTNPPFRAFVSLFSPSTEREFSEQWAHACGEILRVLTHYDRPINKADNGQQSGAHGSPSSGKGSGKANHENSTWENRGRKSSARLLTPWITDSLLAASPEIHNDYFRWCGGVMGNHGAGVLRPPTIVGHEKQPQLLPSSPRGAVANGAAVILSVCNYEVDHYETADLTASAVPALLIRPPPPAFQANPRVVHALPILEPYAQLFHRYYSIATPGATQRLLLGLLESPPAEPSHGLLVAVALIDMLQVADECSSSVQLPRDWFHVHLLNPIGAAIASEAGVVADAASALLFHIFSQPTFLLPPRSLSYGVSAPQSLYGTPNVFSGREEAKAVAVQAIEDNTAAGLAALLVGHGAEVEWRICALWEAALGLRMLSPLLLYVPKLLLSTPVQPPLLSWNSMRPMLRVLEYLPAKCQSRDCLRRIFNATVEAILQRTFPQEENKKQEDRSQTIIDARRGEENKKREDRSQTIIDARRGEAGAKIFGMAELRAMVHCLFTESFLSPNLAAQLLSDTLSMCLSYDAKREGEVKEALIDAKGEISLPVEGHMASKRKKIQRSSLDGLSKNRGAAATFDSYVVAAVCALACEVRLLSFSPGYLTGSKHGMVGLARGETKIHGGLQHGRRLLGVSPDGGSSGVGSLSDHTKRLGVLELLLGGSSFPLGTSTSDSTSEILGESVVAAHMSGLLGQSRACLHSLAEIMKCEWDPGICAQSAAVVSRINRNGGLVAGARHGRNWNKIADCTRPPDSKVHFDLTARETDRTAKVLSQDLPKNEILAEFSPNVGDGSNLLSGQKQGFAKSPNGIVRDSIGKEVANVPLESVDVAALLSDERWNEQSSAVAASLRPIIFEKQDLVIGSVPLLCQRLVFSPEIPTNAEATFAERGWHQVVEALCNVTAVLPEKVAPFVVAQADMQLQPWTGRDGVQSEKSVWRVNTRIVSLLSALLRLCHIPYVVRVVVQECTLLRRATDGLTIDGEACTLPQLELLEAASLAAQAALKWDEPHAGTADLLFGLLKDRLPATVRCLSHSSAHVRLMSVARVRDMLHSELSMSRHPKGQSHASGLDEDIGDNFWRSAVEQCVAWEVHSRRAGGLSTTLLTNAATTLGCSIPT